MSNTIKVDACQRGKRLNHHWSVCVGGGRVAEALRADFQKHLELAGRQAGFQYIRMHGLFHEDMMVYKEHKGKPIYNWQYVDMVFDHWLSIGIRPFVELGFMPYDLASGDQTVFWWQGNVTPPKDWGQWHDLVEAFVRHCVGRYGIEEVRNWYFEVWNEPNLPIFWENRSFDNYMRLYEESAKTVKKVDPKLRVGGPATSGSSEEPGRMPFVLEFLQACEERRLEVDFISTHPYPTNHPIGHDKGVEGVDPEDMVMYYDKRGRLLVDLEGLRQDMRGTPYENVEIHLTEWSSSPSPRDLVHDTAFMASYLIDRNWMARGIVDSLAFWVVSDIFEENRAGDTPFHGGFGLVNTQGIKKPAFHAYHLLSLMGSEELAGGEDYAVTRREDGTVVILLWNYAHYAEGKNSFVHRPHGDIRGEGENDIYDIFEDVGSRNFQVACTGLPARVKIRELTFDQDHGSPYDEWRKLGSPRSLTPDVKRYLQEQGEMRSSMNIADTQEGELDFKIKLPRFGVRMIEMKTT